MGWARLPCRGERYKINYPAPVVQQNSRATYRGMDVCRKMTNTAVILMRPVYLSKRRRSESVVAMEVECLVCGLVAIASSLKCRARVLSARTSTCFQRCEHFPIHCMPYTCFHVIATCTQSACSLELRQAECVNVHGQQHKGSTPFEQAMRRSDFLNCNPSPRWLIHDCARVCD